MRRFVQRLRLYYLPFVVFLTGAAVLIIEVLATRMLSPYFGNTLYTVSSVLGVVLAALSAGYFVGGRMADQNPSQSLFFAIIFFGGMSVLCLQCMAILWLPGFGYQLSITWGPLLISVLLFFLPGFLLGILSPFAIKLQQAKLRTTGIGTIAGEMFFWSTLGSIAGSLSTGFLLVPLFGINATVIGVGVFLCVLGGLPLLFSKLQRKVLAYMFCGAAISIALTIGVTVVGTTHVIYRADGLYEQLTIFDSTYNHQPVRAFQQDRSSSSAMYRHSNELVYEYTKYYELYKGAVPDARKALVIGGAAYSIPKALLAESPTMHVDVAEIEPSLEQLGKTYFRVPTTDRLQTHITDGRRWLATSGNRYDMIFSDVYYSLYSIPAHFTTQEFFKTAKQQLTKNGVFLANLIGDLTPGQPSFLLSELKTFQTVFPNHYLFAVESPHTTDTQNIILVGINGSQHLSLQASTYAGGPPNQLPPLQKQLVNTAMLHLQPHAIFTDNYAPVEYFTAHMLWGSRL